MENMMQVTSRSGHKFAVNTSDKACERFGFKHGDIVTLNHGCRIFEGKVMGVAPENPSYNRGKLVLWIAFNNDNGLVAYSESMHDFSLKERISIKQMLTSSSPSTTFGREIKISRPKKITFKPLARGRFKCNQTGAVLKAHQVDGYARSQAIRV